MKAINLLFISSLILLGCGQSFSDKDENVSTKSFEAVDIEVLEGQEIGEYQVVFNPKSSGKYSVIKHDVVEGESKEIAVGVEGEFIDSDVESGFIYKYEIGRFTEDRSFEKFFEKEIKIPLDIEISESEISSINTDGAAISTDGHSVIEINRLNLAKNSKLFTEGKNLYLKVNRFISHNGTIVTFNEDSVAETGVLGSSGGELLIDANYANGDFTLIMRGQKGGKGTRPEPLGDEDRGEKGPQGSEGHSLSYYSSLPGGPSLPPKGPKCLTSPGNGGKGGKGKKGLTANQGMTGGNSGIAIINIKKSDNFNFQYQMIPGLGGFPSLGGIGSPGGLGGDPGREKNEHCDYDGNGPCEISYFSEPVHCFASPGPEGDQGDIGDSNTNGKPGEMNQICISKNEGEKTVCFRENQTKEENNG